jgi:hypothetical protein
VLVLEAEEGEARLACADGLDELGEGGGLRIRRDELDFFRVRVDTLLLDASVCDCLAMLLHNTRTVIATKCADSPA